MADWLSFQRLRSSRLQAQQQPDIFYQPVNVDTLGERMPLLSEIRLDTGIENYFLDSWLLDLAHASMLLESKANRELVRPGPPLAVHSCQFA
jgi:hypothetical protein